MVRSAYDPLAQSSVRTPRTDFACTSSPQTLKKNPILMGTSPVNVHSIRLSVRANCMDQP
jgi:hypothetical protein